MHIRLHDFLYTIADSCQSTWSYSTGVIQSSPAWRTLAPVRQAA